MIKEITLPAGLHLLLGWQSGDASAKSRLINKDNYKSVLKTPDFANELLDHIVDTVHQPWIDDFFNQFPNGWAEMSDASGSPFFIGPENCKIVAIRAIKRLVDENPWAAQNHLRLSDVSAYGSK